MIEEILRKLTAEIEKLKKHTEQLSTIEKPWSFVPLTTPLTSTDFDGDSFSTTAKTKIDLSVKFGAPAGIKAIDAIVAIRDSGASGGDYWLILSPNNTAGVGFTTTCPRVDDGFGRDSHLVPCDADGDIYYQINANGAGTFNAWITIYGYWR